VVDILKTGDVIYMPVLEDPVSKGKLEAFVNYLEEMGETALLGKIKKLHLPVRGKMEEYIVSFVEKEGLEF
jgi:hypothetical protein